MTPSSSRRITLPVLIISTAVIFLSAAAYCQAQAQPVLDSDDAEVRVDGIYRMKLVGTGFSGGLTILPPVAGTTACWRHIGPGKETDPGMPLIIRPGGGSFSPPDGILRQSVRSRIEFLTPFQPCAEPGVWTSVQVNSSGTGQFTAIVAGKEQGSPPDTRKWIEVRESGQARAYNLIYCDVCLLCEAFCFGTIGTFNVNGKTVLGFGGQSITVQFVNLLKILPDAAVAAT